MDFRRNGSRDERRRRVLLEDIAAEPVPEEAPAPAKRSRGKSEAMVNSRYAPAALGEGQPRLVDLLPRRRLTLWLWLLTGTLITGGLTYAHTQVAGWQARMPQLHLAALDLTERGSLGAWFSSMVMAWAAFTSVQVYLLRRHRSDDYRGSYRLWLWCSAAFLTASVLAATGLHRTAGDGLAHVLGNLAYANIIALAMLAVVGGGLMARMAWEIRESRGAVAAMAGAVMAYATAAIAQLGAVASLTPVVAVVGLSGALLGHCFLLVTAGAFGRYVMLEVRGELVPRRRKASGTDAAEPTKKERRTKSKAATNEQETRTDAKKRTPKTDLESDSAGSASAKSESSVTKPNSARAAEPAQPAMERSAPAKPKVTLPPSDEDDDFEDEDALGSQKLTKAQKRQLRKQQKRQGQRAA